MLLIVYIDIYKCTTWGRLEHSCLHIFLYFLLQSERKLISGCVKMKNLVQDLKPVLLMVLVQIAYSSVNVLYKLAINDGMSIRIVTAYRLIFAVVFTFSLALIFERFLLNPHTSFLKYLQHFNYKNNIIPFSYFLFSHF